MGKVLRQFIISITSTMRVKLAEKPGRERNNTCHGAHLVTMDGRFKQAMRFLDSPAWVPSLRIAFLAAMVVLTIPIQSLASEVTLAWDDNNPTVDGYQVFLREEGQTYDYTNPSWPNDGRDHVQNSCTISGLATGVKYYFVVRAYAGGCQSADSNEVIYIATETSPGTVAEDNHPPEQPSLTGIADGETGVSLTPLLTATEFDDPDPDDAHAGTQWRMFQTKDSQQLILDRTHHKGHLLEFRIPHMVLEPSTEYLVQVRFLDVHNTPSAWSLPVVFTTASDRNDQNRNHIPDSQEILTEVDMNGDTISDLEQALVVKSLYTHDEQHIIGISVELNDPSVQIQAAASIDPANLDYSGGKVHCSVEKLPYGLTGYRIKVLPGEIIAVKLDLSDPLPPGSANWVRYDVVEGISNCDTSTEIDDSGLVAHRYLVDGGDEDADGAVNGVIVDLAGPAEADAFDDGSGSSLALSDDNQASAGGSSGGCFIHSLF